MVKSKNREFPGGLVVWLLSCVRLFVTVWTVALPAPHPWDFPGKNAAVGCRFLLQGIFPTQGSNPCLLHCRWILYHWATREALLWLGSWKANSRMWTQIVLANWAPCGLGLGPWLSGSHCPAQGQSVSQSMWAELSYDCGVWVCTALAFLFPDPACPLLFCSGFCFLCSLQWKTAATMNLRSEHFAVPTVDTAKGSGRSGLPREAFFQWAMSFPGQVMEDKFKGLSPEYFTVRIFTCHSNFIFLPQRWLKKSVFLDPVFVF